jgi:hypothetical protein
MIEFLMDYAMENIDNDLFKGIVLRESSLSNIFAVFMCFAFLF